MHLAFLWANFLRRLRQWAVGRAQGLPLGAKEDEKGGAWKDA